MDHERRRAHAAGVRAAHEQRLLRHLTDSATPDVDTVLRVRTTYPQLARDLGWSRATVIRTLGRLRETGQVEHEIERDAAGRRVASVMRLPVTPSSHPSAPGRAAITQCQCVDAPRSQTG